ncbi:hypothetical protein ACGF12_30535 [Kitasatospora sp. NPDC048296]|uniref:hypothetical protein n=1 Tax=Kitasatospora sp. NPDC048296 TaxID=3364048 RepID=UPI00371BDE73
MAYITAATTAKGTTRRILRRAVTPARPVGREAVVAEAMRANALDYELRGRARLAASPAAAQSLREQADTNWRTYNRTGVYPA